MTNFQLASLLWEQSGDRLVIRLTRRALWKLGFSLLVVLALMAGLTLASWTGTQHFWGQGPA
jgi:hypothetical protein